MDGGAAGEGGLISLTEATKRSPKKLRQSDSMHFGGRNFGQTTIW